MRQTGMSPVVEAWSTYRTSSTQDWPVAKLLRAKRGTTHHVAVDVRPDSSTYLRHVAVELSASNRLGLAVPAECATGYQALEDDTEVFYLVSGLYSPEHERGLRYDDPALGITWPRPLADTSDKDRSWPLLEAPKGDA